MFIWDEHNGDDSAKKNCCYINCKDLNKLKFKEIFQPEIRRYMRVKNILNITSK